MNAYKIFDSPKWKILIQRPWKLLWYTFGNPLKAIQLWTKFLKLFLYQFLKLLHFPVRNSMNQLLKISMWHWNSRKFSQFSFPTSQFVHIFSQLFQYFQLLSATKPHWSNKLMLWLKNLKISKKYFERTDSLRNCSFCKEVQKSDLIAHLFTIQVMNLKQLSRWHDDNLIYNWRTTLKTKLCHSCELTSNWLILRHQSETSCCLYKFLHLFDQKNKVKNSCVKTSKLK